MPIGLRPNAEYHRQDLFEAIKRGEFPQWDLYVQIMPYEDAKTYRFNPFDLTKIWSKKDYPRIKVGTMTLNENPANHFAEIEQAAFSPANMVPGMGMSPDKMLLGRNFAYQDAQRYRIGTNFQQLPVNKPVNEVHTYNFEGSMWYDHSGATPVYAPNSFGGSWSDETGPVDNSWESDGDLVRSAYALHAEDDDFGQPRTMPNAVFDDAAQPVRADRAGALTVPGAGPVHPFPYGRTWTHHRPEMRTVRRTWTAQRPAWADRTTGRGRQDPTQPRFTGSTSTDAVASERSDDPGRHPRGNDHHEKGRTPTGGTGLVVLPTRQSA